MISVVPSLPAQSFEELKKLADSLAGEANELQVDIVDGEFVPAISWPFTEPDPIAALQRLHELPASFSIGLDCMIMYPEKYLDSFLEAGIQRVIVHMRSTDKYEDIIAHAHAHGYTLGIALTNDVPLEELKPYIDKIDFVQIMGIKHVGSQGQPFDERVLITARVLREQYPDLVIAVDGSVNETTIVKLKEAGVNRFAPGSAIAKQIDPKSAYLKLVSLVSQDVL